MTRKDYELIAAHLNTGRRSVPATDHQGFDTAACRVALALAADNPRFDRARFLTAAGVTP